MSTKLNSNNEKKVENIGAEFSEDWLPVKQIMNGMIHLESNEYVTGVKISPKNILILEDNMRNAIISRLENFYNIFDFEFWLITADRPVDISVFMAKLQIDYKNTTDPTRRKLMLQDMQKGNLFTTSEYNVVDTEYYILFKEKRMELIQKKLHNIISGLANSGLQSMQTSNDDLRMLLDNFFNDGTGFSLGTVM